MSFRPCVAMFAGGSSQSRSAFLQSVKTWISKQILDVGIPNRFVRSTNGDIIYQSQNQRRS